MKFSKEVKIGIATIIAIILLIWGFNFLKGKNIFKATNTFYMVYKDLGGLKESNNVLINGVKVGQVTELKLGADKEHKVYVKVLVDNDYPIPKGTVARLASIDFMGTRAIELILSDNPEFHNSGDTLKSRIGEGIMDKVEDFEEKIMQITLRFEELMVKLNSFFSSEMEENLHGTIENLKGTSDNLDLVLNDGRILIKNLDALITQLKLSTKTLPETMENIQAVTDTLREAEIKMLINNTTQTLENLNIILTKIEKGEGTAGQLVKNDSLYANLTGTTKELELLLKDLRENPKRYVHFSVFGKKDKK